MFVLWACAWNKTGLDYNVKAQAWQRPVFSCYDKQFYHRWNGNTKYKSKQKTNNQTYIESARPKCWGNGLLGDLRRMYIFRTYIEDSALNRCTEVVLWINPHNADISSLTCWHYSNCSGGGGGGPGNSFGAGGSKLRHRRRRRHRCEKLTAGRGVWRQQTVSQVCPRSGGRGRCRRHCFRCAREQESELKCPDEIWQHLRKTKIESKTQRFKSLKLKFGDRWDSGSDN